MKVNTVCRLCSGCCPVEVGIQNKKIISVNRIQRYPEPIYQVCPKALAAREIIYSKKRLMNPIVKTVDGFWEKIPWEKAIDILCMKMNNVKKKYGPESVCWLRGQAPDWGGNWHYAMRLMHAFGSPNVFGNGSVCHAGREALQTFTYGDMTVPDYKNSRCIICWGRNDRDTNPTAYEDLLYAKSKGAKLIVIDPIETELAKQSDLWLQIKPGTDGFLAMAFIYWLIKHNLYNHDFVRNYTIGFGSLIQNIENYSPKKISDIVRIPFQKIIEAMQLYVENSPACIAEGNGIDMHCNVSQVTRAIAILRAISGNLDQPGGDLIPQRVRIKNFQLRESFFEKPIPISKDYPLFSQYSENRGIHVLGTLIDAILMENPYPVKGLVVQGANPMVTMANVDRVKKAFRKLEFLVVIDPMMTRTAKLADLILPASFSFEQTMLSNQAVSGNCIRLQKKVIKPLGESKPDWEIIFLIAQALGFKKEFPWLTVEDAINDQLSPSRVTIEDLTTCSGGKTLEETRYRKYIREGFKTPSGKVEIESSLLKEYNYQAIPDFWNEPQHQGPSFYKQKNKYSIHGISGRRPGYFVHSQFHHIDSLKNHENEPFVDINPEDAKLSGIEQNDIVRISTPNGSIKIKANITTIVARKEVRISWGWGECKKNYNLNLLTDDSMKDQITSTTSNRSFMCFIEKVNN